MKILLLILPLFLSAKFYNDTAYIPSQCYTKTDDIHNPCFSCHKNSKEPNYLGRDSEIQEEYAFPGKALKNHWTNLFKDRTLDVAKMSDEEIMKYIRESNYIKNGEIILAKKLANLPKEWDKNGDGKWEGYTPDCYFNFKNGFDINPNSNNPTGWVAFHYYPFLGTFWPTNGSTDDVIIRLPKKFRTLNGVYDEKTYLINLSIVESMIKQKDIAIDEVDEQKYKIDLNRNGKLDIAKKVVYKWNPVKNQFMSYIGDAKEEKIAAGLYPLGTEFLHTVRYIDFDKKGNIFLSKRMKEVRYSRKFRYFNYSELYQQNQFEVREMQDDPDAYDKFMGSYEKGIYNKKGWVFQGFIEDRNGDLRPQTEEETLFCMGCHNGIGATTDSSFAFPRKIDFTKNRGWKHWKNSNYLKNIPEPQTQKNDGEYTLYLKLNRAGDEFRDNFEVMNKFFDENGSLNLTEIKKVTKDISYLLYPTIKRAIELNKAYRVIVKEESYIYGRDAHIKPVKNVHKTVTQDMPTGLKRVNYNYKP
jgi:hypothetical protein